MTFTSFSVQQFWNRLLNFVQGVEILKNVPHAEEVLPEFRAETLAEVAWIPDRHVTGNRMNSGL